MPFDGTDFSPKPERPRRAGGDTMATIIIVALASCSLIVPISMAAIVDLVTYLRGG